MSSASEPPDHRHLAATKDLGHQGCVTAAAAEDIWKSSRPQTRGRKCARSPSLTAWPRLTYWRAPFIGGDKSTGANRAKVTSSSFSLGPAPGSMRDIYVRCSAWMLIP